MTSEDPERIFTPYGELVTLLDAEPSVLREIFKDMDESQLRKTLEIYRNNLNDLDEVSMSNYKTLGKFVWAIAFIRHRLGELDQNENAVDYGAVAE